MTKITNQALWLCLMVCLLLSSSLIAQEQMGLRTERYSGINSVMANPANNINSPFKWDVNLFAAGLFVENSYGYIRQTNLSEILKNTENIRAISEFENESQVTNDLLIFDYFDNQRKKFISTSTFVTGPSIMLNIAQGHSFGIFTNVRAEASSQDIPWQLGYPHFNRTAFGSPIAIPPMQFAAMAWSEIGLNYAYALPTANGTIGLGINLKLLNGYEAFTVQNQRTTNSTQLPGDTILTTNLDVLLSLTTSNADPDNSQIQRNGRGLAIDLGYTQSFFETEAGYQLKIGASLLDLGWIKFKGQAEQHRFQMDNLTRLTDGPYRSLEDAHSLLRQLSTDVLGDPDASLQSNTFSLWLPAALSLQADYSFGKNLYANATLIQRIPTPNGVKRGNLLALTPRFEHRWFAAFLPVGLYNWQNPRIGAALRLAFLTIGSDNIGSIIGKSKWTGTDIYLALRINPFNIGFNGGGGRGGKNVKCYDF